MFRETALISRGFDHFTSPFTSSFFVSIEKIYMTHLTLFHWPSKHLKNTQLHVVFQISSQCLDILKKHCLWCLILYEQSWFQARQQFLPKMATYHTHVLLHYDVVDGNVNEFDEKANESHDSKTNGSCQGNFLELCKGKKTRITSVSTWNTGMLN